MTIIVNQLLVQPVQQHGRPELRGDEVEGEQQWKQVGCKMMSTSLVTIFVSVTNVTNVVMICDNIGDIVMTFFLVTVDLRDWARQEVGVKVFHLVRSQ